MNFYHLLVALMALGFVHAQVTLKVGARALIIARSDSFETGGGRSVKDSLDGYGIPYDIVQVPETGYSGLFELENSPTEGKYAVIILPTGDCQYFDATTNTFPAAIMPEQLAQLDAYEIKYRARRVTMDIFPNPDRFGTQNIENAACCAAGVEEFFALNEATLAKTDAGVKAATDISSLGLYHYNAAIANSEIASPLLTTAAGVVGALVELPNGRKEIVFHMAFGDFSTTCAFLNHIWISWGFRNFYPGLRRVYLSTQVDDIFLTTELWDPALKNQSEAKPYRLPVTALAAHADWQNELNKKLPAGSNYKVELAYNGNGVLIEIKKFGVFLNQTEDAGYDFVKPPGTGYTWWPSTLPRKNWPLNNLRQDALFNYAYGKATSRNYFWLTHTFTHESLNNVSYYDVTQEIAYNQAMASKARLNERTNIFSKTAIVTPKITGLNSSDALKAMYDRGLRSAVGDNSRNIINTQNVHWGVTTTEASHGFNGFFIIPRYATEVYFHCSNPEENLDVYNFILTKNGNEGLTTNDFNVFLSREATRVVRAMMLLRKDPHMFHQANMNVYDAEKKSSLLNSWVNYITNEFTKLVNWPIRTLKQGDLHRAFVQREARDKCGINMFVNFNNDTGVINNLELRTESACRAIVSSPIKLRGNYRSEKFGVDPYSYTIPAKVGDAIQLTPETATVW